MKRKDKERLLIMIADIKAEIRQIGILMRDDDPRKKSNTRNKLNQLWLAVHDLEYILTIVNTTNPHHG